MANTINSDYSKALRERIKKLMMLSGLEIPGFADFIGLSESHVYAIVNGTREVTGEVCSKITKSFHLEEWQFFKLDHKLDKKVINGNKLNKFYDENKGVLSYFINTKEQRKPAYFIENVLLKTKLFDSPVYVSDVREACKEKGKEFESKRISQVLKYLVEKKKLRSKKKPIKLKDGKYGNRMVDVYFKK